MHLKYSYRAKTAELIAIQPAHVMIADFIAIPKIFWLGLILILIFLIKSWHIWSLVAVLKTIIIYFIIIFNVFCLFALGGLK